MKLNKLSIIVLIVVMSIAVISAVVVSTLAIWTETYEDEKTSLIPVGEYNPSEKYFVFVPLDINGNIIEDHASAVSYAVVGYTGLVAEIEVPPTYQPDGFAELPVTAVLADENYAGEAFAGNEFITSIIMPYSITRIGGGVFANMTSVTSVLVRNADPPEAEAADLFVEDYAFMYTTALVSFTYTGHQFIGDFQMAFWGSGFTP